METRYLLIEERKDYLKQTPLTAAEARSLRRRHSRNAWSGQRAPVVSTKLDQDSLIRFQERCRSKGQTPYARIRELILQDLQG